MKKKIITIEAVEDSGEGCLDCILGEAGVPDCRGGYIYKAVPSPLNKIIKIIEGRIDYLKLLNSHHPINEDKLYEIREYAALDYEKVLEQIKELN